MGTYDTLLRAQAANAIGKFASTLYTVTRHGVYDATTDSEAAEANFSVKAIVTSYKHSDTPGDSGAVINGTTVLAGDLKMLVAYNDLPAEAGGDFHEERDFIDVDSVNYRVASIRRVRGGDSVALFELQLRR